MSQQINLFNPDFRRKRELFTAIQLVRVLAVLLVFWVGMYVYDYREVQRLTMQAKSEGAALEGLQATLVETTKKYAPRTKDLSLEKRVMDLEQRLKGEEAVLDVLRGGSLGNTRGYSDYMRAFARQAVSGLWLTEFTIRGAGSDMAIGGRTMRPELVPLYIQRLNQEAVIQGRVFAALEMQLPKVQSATAEKPAQALNYLEFRLYSGSAEEKHQ